MNIIEVIKSGKPFKRKGGDIYAEACEFLRFKVEDVLAEDWEIQEKVISITESQFDEAWRKGMKEKLYVNDVIETIKKELGFN